jgi:hypothetical protein
LSIRLSHPAFSNSYEQKKLLKKKEIPLGGTTPGKW